MSSAHFNQTRAPQHENQTETTVSAQTIPRFRIERGRQRGLGFDPGLRPVCCLPWPRRHLDLAVILRRTPRTPTSSAPPLPSLRDPDYLLLYGFRAGIGTTYLRKIGRGACALFRKYTDQYCPLVFNITLSSGRFRKIDGCNH